MCSFIKTEWSCDILIILKCIIVISCYFSSFAYKIISFFQLRDTYCSSDIAHFVIEPECFELWYILHFEYLTSGISRKQYCERLNRLIGKKYEKRDQEMYDLLLDKQNTALRNAKKLLENYNPRTPANNNPSTTVHLLVQELNKYIK